MPRLNIDIESRFASFQDGLDRIERQTQGAAGRITDAWKKVGAALAGAFAIERITSTIKDVIEVTAALDDMAEVTGASVEALSRFSQIARIGGNDVQQVEKALLLLNKSLSKTDDESKGAGQALKNLGLSLEQVKKLKAEDALQLVADKLNTFSDGAGKTSTAIALLSREGATLLPLLKDMANFQGIVATVTGEQAAQAEAAANAVRKFKVEISNSAQALTLQFLPAITKTLEEMQDGARIFGGFFAALSNIGAVNPFQNTQAALNGLNGDLEKLIKQRDQLANNPNRGLLGDKELSSINEQIDILQKQVTFYRNKASRDALAGAASLGDTTGERRFGSARSSLADLPYITPPDSSRAGASAKVFDESAMSVAFLRSNVHLLDAEIAKAVALYQEWIRNVNAIVQPVTRQADAMERLNEIYGLSESEVARKVASEVEEAAVLAELNGAYESQVKQLFDVAGAYRRIADASDKARLALALAETASGKLAKQRADMEFFADALKRGEINASEFSEIVTAKLGLVAEETGKAKSAAEEFGLTLVSEAERAILHWEGFGNLMRSIGADLKQFAARKLITEPLANAVSGAFGAQTNGTGSLLNAGSSIAGLFSGSSAAASSAFTSFAFSGLGSSLGLSTAGAIAGPTATGAALSGSLTAGGAALGALAAAAPYIAAVIAIASLFAGKGGGPKTEGSFDTANIERFFTATNSDDQAKAFVENLKASYADLAKQFGGVANEQLRLAFGFALDPQGTAQNAAHLAVGNSQFIIDQGRPDDFAAQAAEYLNRGILEALKQTDLYDSIDQLLAAFDPFTATSDQVTAEMDAITQALQNVIAAGEGYRQSIAAIAMQMQDSQNMFADSIRSIQLSQLDAQGQYQFLDAEAARFRDVLASLSDPALIKEYASKLNSTINSAFGLLDSSEQSRLAGSYIEKLTQSSQLTQDRLSAAAELQRAQFAELPAEIKKSIDAAMTTAVAAIQAAVSKGVTVDFRANVPGTTELALIG